MTGSFFFLGSKEMSCTKELGMMFFLIEGEATEPQNPQNHRLDVVVQCILYSESFESLEILA